MTDVLISVKAQLPEKIQMSKTDDVVDCKSERLALVNMFSNTVFIRTNSRQNQFNAKVRSSASAKVLMEVVTEMIDSFETQFAVELEFEKLH